MADRISVTRDVAVLMRYVFDERRKKKPAYSQRDFAEELFQTRVMQEQARPKKFEDPQISKLLNGSQIISAADARLIPQALTEIMAAKGITEIALGAIPVQLLLQYRAPLLETFGDFANYIPRPFAPLGEAANAFKGLWRFFYVSSNGDAPTINSNVVFFQTADAGDPNTYGMIVGPSERRWIVTVWVAAQKSYVYLQWHDPKGPSTSLMISSSPERGPDGFEKIAGMILFLRPAESDIAHDKESPVMSTFFFGTRCTLDNCGVGKNFQFLHRNSPRRSEIDDLVNRAVMGGSLTPEQERGLANSFRRTEVPIELLKKKFAPLLTYLQSHDYNIYHFGGREFVQLIST